MVSSGVTVNRACAGLFGPHGHTATRSRRRRTIGRKKEIVGIALTALAELRDESLINPGGSFDAVIRGFSTA
jgi:hypothetical protein